MASTVFITIEEFSNQFGIQQELIQEFMDFGLVTIYRQQEGECLMADDTEHVARLIRLYRDLGINKEGIDIILSMRDQLIQLHDELNKLRNKAQRLEQQQEWLFFDMPRSRGLLLDHDENP
jgi:DNA-binding transcriptional MerR regulator